MKIPKVDNFLGCMKLETGGMFVCTRVIRYTKKYEIRNIDISEDIDILFSYRKAFEMDIPS